MLRTDLKHFEESFRARALSMLQEEGKISDELIKNLKRKGCSTYQVVQMIERLSVLSMSSSSSAHSH